MERMEWRGEGWQELTRGDEILFFVGRLTTIFPTSLVGRQLTLFTRGKAPVTTQIPGESDEDFKKYSEKVGRGWGRGGD